MWFKKKEIKEEVKPEIKEKIKEKSDLEIAVDKLKAFRDVGEKFNYLGVEMMVTGHWELNPYYTFSIYDYVSPFEACLKVDYVTKNGEIKGGSFYVKDLEMLKKENPKL